MPDPIRPRGVDFGPAAAERPAETEFEGVTSPADIASAGRSCVAILILAIVIVLLLIAWIAFSATGRTQ